MKTVFYHNDSGRAWITIDNPPLNALSPSVQAGLIEAIASAEQDACTTGVIVCLGRSFIACSDNATPDRLQNVYQTLEQSPVIWAVALHGAMHGCGLELALAANIRVATADTLLEYPQAHLGLTAGADEFPRVNQFLGAAIVSDLTNHDHLLDAQALLTAGAIDSIVGEDVEAHIDDLLNAIEVSML